MGTLILRGFIERVQVTSQATDILKGTVKDNPKPVTVDEVSMARDGSKSLPTKQVFFQPADIFNMPS